MFLFKELFLTGRLQGPPAMISRQGSQRVERQSVERRSKENYVLSLFQFHV